MVEVYIFLTITDGQEKKKKMKKKKKKMKKKKKKKKNQSPGEVAGSENRWPFLCRGIDFNLINKKAPMW